MVVASGRRLVVAWHGVMVMVVVAVALPIAVLSLAKELTKKKTYLSAQRHSLHSLGFGVQGTPAVRKDSQMVKG